MCIRLSNEWAETNGERWQIVALRRAFPRSSDPSKLQQGVAKGVLCNTSGQCRVQENLFRTYPIWFGFAIEPFRPLGRFLVGDIFPLQATCKPAYLMATNGTPNLAAVIEAMLFICFTVPFSCHPSCPPLKLHIIKATTFFSPHEPLSVGPICTFVKGTPKRENGLRKIGSFNSLTSHLLAHLQQWAVGYCFERIGGCVCVCLWDLWVHYPEHLRSQNKRERTVCLPKRCVERCNCIYYYYLPLRP